MPLSCECCVLSGKGHYVGLITCPEVSYRVWRVCDHEALIMRRPWPIGGCCAMGGRERRAGILCLGKQVTPNFSLL
jgi:hypothetical protein